MSQRTHLVVGAGPIGSAVVRRLVAQGDTVRVVTRSGSGPDLPGVEKVAADAADSARMAELAGGCDVVYNCVNPAYHRWATDWPPVAAALLGAAERSGAVLVTTANLYGYGHVDRRITEDMPLTGGYVKADVRNRMWLDALAAHEAGRVRVTEARGADYVGPGAESHLGERVLPKVLAGKKAQVMRSLDTQHTWTYTEDILALEPDGVFLPPPRPRAVLPAPRPCTRDRRGRLRPPPPDASAMPCANNPPNRLAGS